ncbi:MAG: hypothetical protein L6R36_000489 [Xanthoria steineri]|nr:MAG: hypothetical protein L6R36_000489 [Xanthoria steineri]
MDDIPFAGRITYQVTALIALAILSLMAGSRITALKEAYYRRLGFVHVLVFAIYAIGLFFIFATNLMLAGWHFGEAHICRAGAYLCLACYVSFKALVYLYLVDRVHATREDRHGRKMAYLDDYVCLVLYVLVISGVVVIYAFAFLYPIAYTGITRKCIVGLPPWIAISLLSLDSALSVILTAILWYLTQKSTGKKKLRLTCRLALHALPFCDPNPLLEDLVGLPPAQFMTASKEGHKRLQLAKALWGTIALIIPTATNLGVLLSMGGHEQGWLCVSACIGDVLWSIIVIHWLTNGAGTIRLQSQLEIRC